MPAVKLGVVMDPIQDIIFKKDSSLALLEAAQKQGCELYYMEMRDIWVENGQPHARMQRLVVFHDPHHWFEFHGMVGGPLADLDVILDRLMPPYDAEFIYGKYVLELAEKEGVLVVNRPSGLRSSNEKLFTLWFPECCPPTLVSRDAVKIINFIQTYEKVVLKPLGMMCGASIFVLTRGDPNTNVVIETMTDNGARFTMVQKYIPEIVQGDKRIFLIDGKPVDHAVLRVPQEGESRGNLARGAHAIGFELNSRDRWLCSRIGPELRKRGLLFVGLDVIGDYITEINSTCPTGIRELDSAFGINIADTIIRNILEKVPK